MKHRAEIGSDAQGATAQCVTGDGAHFPSPRAGTCFPYNIFLITEYSELIHKDHQVQLFSEWPIQESNLPLVFLAPALTKYFTEVCDKAGFGARVRDNISVYKAKRTPAVPPCPAAQPFQPSVPPIHFALLSSHSSQVPDTFYCSPVLLSPATSSASPLCNLPYSSGQQPLRERGWEDGNALSVPAVCVTGFTSTHAAEVLMLF